MVAPFADSHGIKGDLEGLRGDIQTASGRHLSPSHDLPFVQTADSAVERLYRLVEGWLRRAL